MQKTLNNSGFSFTRTTQISESHCGPAVLQMLLSHAGFEINQKELTKASQVGRLIHTRGMRIDQMDFAIRKLNLPVTFWYKHNSTLDTVRELLSHYHLPVGVEWQGLFDPEWEEDPDEDYGHYSVVIQIDDLKQKVVFVDPYKDYSRRNRIMNISKFEKRWWDVNEIATNSGRKTTPIRDDQLLFVVTSSDFIFPDNLGMQKFT